jgi:hypothetical protein
VHGRVRTKRRAGSDESCHLGVHAELSGIEFEEVLLPQPLDHLEHE